MSEQKKSGIIGRIGVPTGISGAAKVLLALLLVALLFKIYLLYKRSLSIDADEGYYLLLARNLLAGHGYTLNGLPNIIFPPLLPLLISAFHLLWRDIQFSLMFTTAVSGVLIGAVCYLLARRKFSPKVSVSCAALALFVFQLNAFLPILKPYIGTLYRGSEILNCLLVLSSIYFIVRFVERDRIVDAVFAGGCIAGAYLTRPESLLFFVILLVGVALLRIRGWVSVSYKRITAFLLVFVFISSPYWIYLRTVTGEWSLSGKIAASQGYREALLEVIENDDWGPFREIHYAIDAENMEMSDAYWGYHDKVGQKNEVSFWSRAENIVENFGLYYHVPKILFPWYLLVFFLIGLGVGIYKAVKHRSIVDIMLLLLLPYSVLIAVLSYPIPRHHLFLVPASCVYSIEGVLFLSSILSKNRVTIKRILVALFSLVLVVFIAWEYVSASRKNYLGNDEYRQRMVTRYQMSQYLRGRDARVIMSTQPDIAVGAFSDWQVMPQADFPSVLKFGRKKGVDYLVFRKPLTAGYSYYIVDLKDSGVPENTKEQLGFQLIERHVNFDLVRIVATDVPPDGGAT
jgi:hypothetical protein